MVEDIAGGSFGGIPCDRRELGNGYFEFLICPFDDTLALWIIWDPCTVNNVKVLTELSKGFAGITRAIVCLEPCRTAHMGHSCEHVGDDMFSCFPRLQGGEDVATKGVNRHVDKPELSKGKNMSNIHLPEGVRDETFGIDPQIWGGQVSDAFGALFNNCAGLFPSYFEESAQRLGVKVV